MKTIFKLIFLIFDQIISSSSVYSKSTQNNVLLLGKLIDALEDDDEFLEENLPPVELEGIDRGEED